MLDRNPLVTIIMPVFNARDFLYDSINSVISQSYSNWELLIINDGSTDESEEIINLFNDERICYFKKSNNGVSSARNVGLQNMRGKYFCFLDSDDLLSFNSIKDRLSVFFDDDRVDFVDGRVQIFDQNVDNVVREYVPTFEGDPFNSLLKLSEECFFGITWMIKNSAHVYYNFRENLTHGEDLLFYLSICSGKLYKSTDKVIYKRRIGHESAMSSLTSLENGYFNIYNILCHWPEINQVQLKYLLRRIKKIMFKSYLGRGKVLRALNVLLR
ncbi:glycosyltransferase family A protein [Fulvivirga ligni]|uniref:glycosyltransferase family A protein n=1 Tax=Fulvivirga ligni TaxID=2904246 RepID=UPI001F349E04|nr:glycosyltransferase family 2 protein [Fulvivirga ligni]UII21822.1 glycosyltransferase family 2 protein [Fulvivirga ligni]